MKSMGHGYVYVSGRTRAKGETNGKSGNLNNVFAQIYPAELDIPGNECLVVFDADQVGLACLSKRRHEPRNDTSECSNSPGILLYNPGDRQADSL